jgi:hypothetical protein
MKKSKFKVGQWVFPRTRDVPFCIEEVMPCFNDGKRLSGYKYLEQWSWHDEKSLRAMTAREKGR